MYSRSFPSVPRRFPRAAAMAAIAGTFLFAAAASAQTTATVYSGKFACGTVSGTLPNSTDATPPAAQVIYRDVQPGSYSTVMNIVHTPYTPPDTSQLASMNLTILVEGLGATTFNLGFAPFTEKKIGCPIITQHLAQAFPAFVADGRFVEGYLHLRVTSGGQPEFQDVSILYSSAVRMGTTGVGSSMQVEHLVGKTVPNYDVE